MHTKTAFLTLFIFLLGWIFGLYSFGYGCNLNLGECFVNLREIYGKPNYAPGSSLR